MFINDLNDFLTKEPLCDVVLDELILTSLLFADDMIILSNTRHGLQCGLDSLYEYCKMLDLKVNVEKKKLCCI